MEGMIRPSRLNRREGTTLAVGLTACVFLIFYPQISLLQWMRTKPLPNEEPPSPELGFIWAGTIIGIATVLLVALSRKRRFSKDASRSTGLDDHTA